MISLVKRHPIITFFVLTYAIGWGLIPFWTFQAGSPFIAALIVIPITRGLSGLKELGLRMIRWRVRWYWYVVAIALPLAVVGLTVVLNVALGASAPSLAGVGSVSTILMMFAIRLINPGDGALGEEPGWRGVALPGLQSTLSPLVSTLILGVAAPSPAEPVPVCLWSDSSSREHARSTRAAKHSGSILFRTGPTTTG